MSHPKLFQKEDKYQALDFQESMDKKILKLATLKSSSRLNMQRPREENYKALNAAEDNGAT